jgi:hypothetical protein
MEIFRFPGYCRGFHGANQPWPLLPLEEDPTLAWWQELLGPDSQVAQGWGVINALAAALPQLRLPQVPGISKHELYRALVLRGEDPKALSPEAIAGKIGSKPQWEQPEQLQLWIKPHPCGAMPVLQTPSWTDFALLVRALAHRCEPVPLANGVHAQAISGLIHWGLIQQFGRQSRAQLIILHQAPYGSVCAKHVPGGLSDGAWLKASTTLRLEHELTHLATKRLLGEMRLNLFDELIADCMGMVAALGQFDASFFGRCLGLGGDGQPISNGRWLSYVHDLSEAEALHAIALVMERARELQMILEQRPKLLESANAMERLHWLCMQRLDAVFTLDSQAGST